MKPDSNPNKKALSFFFIAFVALLSFVIYGLLFVAMYGSDLGDPKTNPLVPLKNASLGDSWLVKNLPNANALLNLLTMVLLAVGLRAAYKRRIARHIGFVVSALTTSFLFGMGYVTYHFFHGHTSYSGVGASKVAYLAVLTTHTLACVWLVPMVVVLVSLAATKRFDHHKSLAKWTFPLWYFVLVTGLLIYAFLYLL